MGANEPNCGACQQHQAHDGHEQTLTTETLRDVAELLGLFGDTTRVRILYELTGHELCVSEIAETLGMTASAISHQLRILKQGSLVRSRREGKTVYYALADSHVKAILHLALEHVTE